MCKKTNKQLIGHIGEHLACAQLGKLGYLATPFAGNVPIFDLLIANKDLQSLPIQIKTSTTGKWKESANKWLNIEIDHKNKKQIDKGDKKIENPNLIYIYILLSKSSERDRFFILNKKQLQKIIASHYRNYMNGKNWIRPKKYDSYDCTFIVDEINMYENKWGLIKNSIGKHTIIFK